MTIAFDAFTSNTNATPGTFSHTPVGTPKGVIYMTVQNSTIDQISAATYGGVSMTRLTPLTGVSGDEDMMIYVFWLGSSVAAGVQDVVVTTSNTSAKTAIVATVTAAADIELDAQATQDAVEANPSMDIATTVSTTTFVIAALASGHGTLANVTPGGSYTEIYENTQASVRIGSFIYRTSNPTGGTVSVDWTATSEDAHIFAIALKEATVLTTRRLQTNVSPRRW